MQDVVRASIAEGAIGFSSSRALAHSDDEERPVPSRVANERELIQRFGTCSEFPGTSLEFNLRNGGPRDDEDFRLLTRLSR